MSTYKANFLHRHVHSARRWHNHHYQESLFFCTNLFNVSVEGTLLAEDIGTMGTNDAFHFVVSSHVRREVRRLLTTLGAGQILKTRHVNLQSVDVQGGLGGELLVAVGTLLD